MDTKPLAKELAKLALTKKADFMSTIAGLKDQLASGASNVGNSMMSGASDLKTRLLAAYNQLSPDAKAALISSLAGGAGMGAASLLTGGASPLADALLGSALGGIGGYAGSNLYRKYKGEIAPPNANVDPKDIQHAITAANPDYVQDMLGQGAVGGLSGAGLGYAAQGMHNMTAGRIPKLQELAAEFHKNPNAITSSLAAHKNDISSFNEYNELFKRMVDSPDFEKHAPKLADKILELQSKLRTNTPGLAKSIVDDSIARWFRGGTTTIDGKALPEANWFRRHGMMGDGFSTPTAGIRKILDNTLREAGINSTDHLLNFMPAASRTVTNAKYRRSMGRALAPYNPTAVSQEINWNGMIDKALDAHMSPARFGAPKLKWIGPAAATGAALTTVGPHVLPYISSILEHGLGQDQ